jgi:anion-transporting  ArsA/GET3 family ATPase
LLDLAQRRLVIVTGKGGVGKTTIAAALARKFARTGKRVLCAEIAAHEDTPSALSPALGGPALTDEPVSLASNIWGCLLTPSMGHRRFLQDTLPLKLLADAAMRSQGLRRFLMAAPGFSDMGVMYRMMDLMRLPHRDGGFQFEYCVIDSPATGHALALAQIPDLLTRVIPGGPILRAAKEGLAMLTDEKLCATLVVTLPETLPVTESLELSKGLRRHRLPVAGVLVNRVPADPFSDSERVAVHAVLHGSDVLGHREMQRIARATTALAYLRERTPHQFITLPELDATGADLSRQLATLLSPGSSPPPASR